MAQRQARSLKHEYGIYVEREIEDYKESVPRAVLLGIGDEAVSVLARQPQMALTEMLLCEEVDRLIVRRLRLPSYTTWKKRRLKLIAELSRPEHWGLHADHAVVHALRNATERSVGQVLVAGMSDESRPLYLAANGCHVTAFGDREEAVERVITAAAQAGLADRLDARVGDIASWEPDGPLAAVIMSPAVLASLASGGLEGTLNELQQATVDGGIHLVEPSAQTGDGATAMTIDELRARYRGWDVSMVAALSGEGAMLARKGVA